MNDPHGNKILRNTDSNPDDSPSSPGKKSDRDEKLARQLRANLVQRKAQARARKNNEGKSTGSRPLFQP